jgi:hypothetical protein
MCEVPPKLMQQQHEMLALALVLLSKGQHTLPTTKAAVADAACCSARKLPLDAKAAVVPLQNRYTQNIVGFDRERGIFSTDIFRWYCMQKTAQDST